MKTLFEYQSYKDFINDLILTYPKDGRGVFSKLAKSIGVSSVLISQIFKGDKDLNTDQAILTAEFFELQGLELDYFIALVSKERAATPKLRSYYAQKLYELEKDALDIKNQIESQNKISDQAKSEFYSSWYYSAIRLVCALPEIETIEHIAQYLKIPQEQVENIVKMLIANKLLFQTENGLEIGTGSTHIDKTDPLVHHHRRNWRLKAMSSFEDQVNENLFYVAPIVMSENLADVFRQKLMDVIKDIYKEVPKEDPETTFCLNIDFFKF